MASDEEIERLRRRFDRLTERRPVSSIRSSYGAAQSDASREIRRRARKLPRGKLSARQMRSLGVAVRREQARAVRGLLGEMLDIEEEAHRDSLRGLDRFVARMEGRSDALADRVQMEQRRGRLRELRASARGALRDQVTQINTSLQVHLQRATVEGMTRTETVGLLEDAADRQSWRVERLMRTRAATAYNAAQLDGIDALVEEFPDVYGRWVEHVDDSTWQPTDDRVAPDSLALHGQVQPPGELFVMPAGGPGEGSWFHPPNRPNDRAIVMPWRKAWKIPAYTIRSGRKLWLVRR